MGNHISCAVKEVPFSINLPPGHLWESAVWIQKEVFSIFFLPDAVAVEPGFLWGDDKGLCIGTPTAVFPVFSVICPDTEGIGTFIVDPIFKAAGGSRAGKGGKSASVLKKLYFILVCPIYLIPDGCMTAPVRCKGSRNGPVDSGQADMKDQSASLVFCAGALILDAVSGKMEKASGGSREIIPFICRKFHFSHRPFSVAPGIVILQISGTFHGELAAAGNGGQFSDFFSAFRTLIVTENKGNIGDPFFSHGSKGQAQGNKGSCAEGLQRMFLHKNSPFRICIARHTGRAHAFPAAGQ